MYRVIYHQHVPDDVAVIDTVTQSRIKRAIEVKLMVDPIKFGKPLQHSLSGLRTLRVGDYRIVYQITKSDVLILLIAHRSIVYKTAHKRSQ